MRIGIDFDDVIYPYHHYLKRKVKEEYGVDLSDARVTTFFYNHLPELVEQGATRDDVWGLVEATWRDGGDHAEAEPLDPEIPQVIDRLRQDHAVLVVTARSADARGHVEAFLRRHDITVDDVLLGRFDKTGFDVLIDDFPKHAVENARHGGWSLLFTIDENSTFDETKEPRVLRVASWREVEESITRIAEAVQDP